jgi:acetyl-CoA C-acetyltransferase
VTAFITGWSHTRFGVQSGQSLSSLAGRCASTAIAHAGLRPDEIDEIYLSSIGANLDPHLWNMSQHASADLQFKPVTRVENADASGTAAIFQASKAIRSGDARHVLVIGAEKHPDMARQDGGTIDLPRPGSQAVMFAAIAETYVQLYGSQCDALATIAAKNHKNAVGNPYAHFQTDLGFDFCRYPGPRNPVVAGCLKRTDCSPASEGAAALVLSSEDASIWMPRAIRFRARVQVNDWVALPCRAPLFLPGCQQAWQRAFQMAGLGLHDLSLLETHDSSTMAELLQYEAMGLAMPGRGGALALEGYTALDGRLPVNPSGGLNARGNPAGATGVSQHVMAAMQLCDEAEDFQVPNASLAGVYTMGGQGFANYVSILERAW